jgi:hypothetical protein
MDLLSSDFRHVRKQSNCDKKEKKAPVHNAVYLLDWSQLLGEATLGQHRQQDVYQAPFNITINTRELKGGDTQQKHCQKRRWVITNSLFCARISHHCAERWSASSNISSCSEQIEPLS